jgi:hypothetical protein
MSWTIRRQKSALSLSRVRTRFDSPSSILVTVVPLVLGQHGDRMRSVLQQVVVPGLFALDDLLGFSSDADHRIAESIDLFLAFALGGLDEHSRRNGPRDGGS